MNDNYKGIDVDYVVGSFNETYGRMRGSKNFNKVQTLTQLCSRSFPSEGLNVEPSSEGYGNLKGWENMYVASLFNDAVNGEISYSTHIAEINLEKIYRETGLRDGYLSMIKEPINRIVEELSLRKGLTKELVR